MKNIKIFLSSSLKHDEERKAFMKAFAAEETEDVRFDIYAHEVNGVMAITPGSDSQDAINAAAIGCQAFITYAGDIIGKATIDEFLNEIHDSKSIFKFIYVIHQPGLKPIITDESRYVDYITEFEQVYLEKENLKYYATNLPPIPSDLTSIEEIREIAITNIINKATHIAQELKNKTIPELYPHNIDYLKVISDGQKEYRDATSFYYHRTIDDDLKLALHQQDSPLVIVSGTSLAGKTRAVTEALHSYDDPNAHIHVLQYNSSSISSLHELNPPLQFRKEFTNILFIDEIDKILANSEITSKFIEICRFASMNRGRLKIVTTSITPGNEIIDKLLQEGTSDSWIDNCTLLTIPPLFIEEISIIIKELRRRGLLSIPTKKIANGMPLGALFIDLNRMQNIYHLAIKRDRRLIRLFDAIKCLWIWKVESRGDISVLINFCNNAYKSSMNLNENELWNLFKLIPEFVTVEGDYDYSFSIEEILVHEVLTFENGIDEEPAIKRIVQYIHNHLSNPFENYTKLINRLIRAQKQSLAKIASEYITHLYGNDIISLTENEKSLGNRPINWVENYMGMVASLLADGGDLHKIYNLWETCRYDTVLSNLIHAEHSKGVISESITRLINDKSNFNRFKHTISPFLTSELVTILPFDDAVELVRHTDYRNMALCTSAASNIKSNETSDSIIEFRCSRYVRNSIRNLTAKINTYNDLEKVSNVLSELNSTLGITPYNSLSELYFRYIGSYTWSQLSKTLPSYPLLSIFLKFVKLPCDFSDNNGNRKLLLEKSECLNSLMTGMDEKDIIKAWKALGVLQDLYSLRNTISRVADFAQGKGIIDSYLLSDHGKTSKLNPEVLNTLLNKCKTSSDYQECEKLFQRSGILSPDKGLIHTKDEYTQGIIINFTNDVVDYNTKIALLHIHRPKDENETRNIKTISPIVQYTDNYTTAANYVFGPCPSFLTLAEQEKLRYSPVVISWIFKKVCSEEEKNDAMQKFAILVEQEKNLSQYESILNDKGGNVLTEILHNNKILPTTTDVNKFIADYKTNFPDFELENYVNLAFIGRLLEDKSCNKNQYTIISHLNELIINLYKDPKYKDPEYIKHIRRAVKFRATLARRTYDKTWIQKSTLSPYPLINKLGEFVITKTTPRNFAMNMLEYGILHPALISDLIIDTINHPNATDEINRIIEITSKNKVFLKHKIICFLYKELNKRNIDSDIYAIAKDYSIIKDMTKRLHNGYISVEEALKQIDIYEKRTGITVYRSIRFMHAVMKGLTSDPKESLKSILSLIDSFPQNAINFQTQHEPRYFLLHKIRSLSDFNILLDRFGGTLNANDLKGLMAALRNCDYANRTAIMYNAMPFIESLASNETLLGDDILMGLLRYRKNASVQSSLEFFNNHGRLITSNNALGFLLDQVETFEDYILAVNTCPNIKLNVNHVRIMLYHMFDYQNNTIKSQIFNEFDRINMIDKWSNIAKRDSNSHLLNAFKSIKSKLSDNHDEVTKRFIIFWEKIIGI